MIIDVKGEPFDVERAELEAKGVVDGTMRELAHRRLVLNADEFASLENPRPRLEKEINLRPVENVRLKVWLFSIDGVLNGNAVVGCLFAGECIMVTAPTFEQANKLATDGLHATKELLHEEFAARVAKDALLTAEGLRNDAAGRRMRPSEAGKELSTDPKLKAMMAHAIGGLPWKW